MTEGKSQIPAEFGREFLLQKIEQTAKSALKGGKITEILCNSGPNGRTLTTTYIKQTFGALGHSLGYFVNTCGAHYPDTDGGEWLYDMLWSHTEEDGDYEQFMVLESELETTDTGAVDDDFLKLVQARADVRVYIAVCNNRETAHQLIGNCKRAASAFRGAVPGDAYVFAVWDWTTGRTSVERFCVPAPATA